MSDSKRAEKPPLCRQTVKTDRRRQRSNCMIAPQGDLRAALHVNCSTLPSKRERLPLSIREKKQIRQRSKYHTWLLSAEMVKVVVVFSLCVWFCYPVSSGMSWSASAAEDSTSASALLSLPWADRPHGDSGLALSPLGHTHTCTWFRLT